MRWLVEVSSLGKTDLQKFCVEAESWQRALQAARAQRGEDGPMSGFSIELLEEGYRAVDPLARVRFVVKRAPDDMPITASTPAASPKDGKSAVAPTPVAASGAAPSAAPTEPKMMNPPTSSQASGAGAPPAAASSQSVKKAAGVPRPGGSVPPPAPGGASSSVVTSVPKTNDSKKMATMTFGSKGDAQVADATDKHAVSVDRTPPPAVGAQIPGLPAVKLLTSREQEPNDKSPLTYREYAFAVPDGTSEDASVDVLRAQLRLVEAHIADAKMGRLVNLAVFDVEFTGKPPRPPVATLTWKDWKGDPVIAYPRRSGAPASKQPKPPEGIPASLVPAMMTPQAPPVAPVAQAPVPAGTQPGVAPAPVMPQVATPAPPIAVPAPQQARPAPAVPSNQQATQPIPPEARPAPPPAPPVAQPAPNRPPSNAGFPAVIAAAASQPSPVMTESSSKHPSAVPPPGMVKTPSGRFVRGRVSGDELITALFESMHDLHFLRDALDGGQFCLALATEVLPSRAALIHFFDVEKRQWVVACTRGKETARLLNVRTPENDELLRESARKRRALVVGNAAAASADRYKQLGGSRSLIVAPIMQAGRALGALEIINPLDGMPFTEDEGNAMTYIAEQYAEYLGSRGIVLDRDRITSAAVAR